MRVQGRRRKNVEIKQAVKRFNGFYFYFNFLT